MSEDKQDVVNVSSRNQKGGQTAGIINNNYGQPERKNRSWLEIASWIAAVIVGIITIVSFIGDKDMDGKKTASVTSYNQTGGQTAGVINNFAPPPITENEVTGTLQPGNEPTPPNDCDGRVSDNALKVLMGKNAFAKNGMGKIIALQIANCPVLSMERTANGIFVNADLYSGDGKLIARIEKNQIHALTGEQVRASRNGDLSTLIVTDGSGNELLNVRYLNPTTVQVRGIFACRGHAPITITDGVNIPGFHGGKMCGIDSVIGISID